MKSSIIDLTAFRIENFSLVLKREDLIHPYISGNKFRKLKYNLIEAKSKGCDTLLTFGGAFSNHLVAVAYAGKIYDFKTIGIIRGEELLNKKELNPTLTFCKECGMKLHFVTRKEYQNKNETFFKKKLATLFGNFYLIPEGGTNNLAIRGCEEILSIEDKQYDYVCTSVGTGGTIAGLVSSSFSHQQILGFSALKGTFQSLVIQKYTAKTNYKIIDDNCFGGYAKIDIKLIRFINDFKEKTGIALDPIYTGKMMYGVFEMMKKGVLKKNSRILAIHTGGLQGISGMNELLKKKNLPQIN